MAFPRPSVFDQRRAHSHPADAHVDVRHHARQDMDACGAEFRVGVTDVGLGIEIGLGLGFGLTQQRARPLLYMAAPRTFRQLRHAHVTLPMDLQRHIAQGGGEREAVIRVGLGLGLGLGVRG